jgi:hypothetical protein
MTEKRAADGAAWDLEKIHDLLRAPTLTTSNKLILVTAHRGAWEYCPENSIQGAMLAMDKAGGQLELIEMDVRVTADGHPYLTHDWDLRGEALNPVTTQPTGNNIYQLQASEAQLGRRIKPDRYGKYGFDDKGQIIQFQDLGAFLDKYVQRAMLIKDGVQKSGVQKSKVQRGAVIVLDIKGEDTKVKSLAASSQWNSLQKIVGFVAAYQTKHHIDLSNALVYKLNLKALTTATPATLDSRIFPDTLEDTLQKSGLGYNPDLIFIIYPEDWTQSGDPSPYELWSGLLKAYQNKYTKNLMGVDWQSRFPGINIEKAQWEDVKQNRGTGAFVSYNPFPEGMRRSDGTCTFQGKDYGTECLEQGLMQYASASLEYFFPPQASGHQVFATNLTTDMFENASNYLTVIGRRDRTLIAWNESNGKAVDPVAERSESDPAQPRQPAAAPHTPPSQPLASQSSEAGLISFDVGVASKTKICTADKPLWNYLQKQCVSIQGVVTDQQATYFQAGPDGATLTQLDRAITSATGFTIAVDLAPSEQDVDHTIRNVFSLTGRLGGQSVTLFSVLRDDTGHWYTGKQIDRMTTPMSFDTKLWDPVSSCGTGCSDETLFISFEKSGEVRLDDLSILNHGKQMSVDWQAGLMNYGLPVNTYQGGTAKEWPNWPVKYPDFMALKSLSLRPLASNFYGESSIYKNPETSPFPSARIKRITIWTGGMIGKTEATLDKSGVLRNANLFRDVEQQILDDYGRLHSEVKLNNLYLPCNTGQYQFNVKKDGDGITRSTQYTPNAQTPCNPDGETIPLPVVGIHAPQDDSSLQDAQ